MPLSARDRMIRSAALLMREHGPEAMSFSQVVVHSKAPRGSIYHYFPGGKAQLVEEATRYAGEFIAKRSTAAIEADGPLGLFDVSKQFWKDVLANSDYAAGCVVVAAALEGQRAPAVRHAAGEAFRLWQSLLSESLLRRGVEPDEADALATTVLAGMEGAIILARAQRSMAPLERVYDQLKALVSRALDEAAAATGRT